MNTITPMHFKMIQFCKRLMRQTSVRLRSDSTESCEAVMFEDEKKSSESNNDEKRSEASSDDEVESEAPEGGWGYMVAIGFSIMFIVVTGPNSSYGIIFKDLFDGISDGTSGLALVNGVYNGFVSFTGFFTTSILKKFSLRQVGLVGSLVYVLGTTLTIFVTSVPYLVFSAGVLQGIGFGIMIPISLTSFNNYFVKRRVAFMGVTSVLVGAGMMLFPLAIKYFMENYGFRGTLAILCGISCHAILAMVIMEPVEWHVRLNSKRDKEMITITHNFTSDIILNKDKLLSEKLPEFTTLSIINESEKESDGEKKEPLLIKNVVQKIQIQPRLSLATIEKQNYNNVIFGSSEDIVSKPKLSRTLSLSSLGNWTSAVLASEAIPTKNGTWQTLLDTFDLGLLKDPIYSNICFGMSFAFFSEITFFVLEPVLLYHYGFSQSEVAICITAGAAADLIFRVIFAMYTFRFTVNSRTVFYVGTICITIIRIVFMQFTDFYPVLILTACLGIFRSWLHVFLPLVFAENCPSEKFPVAYGLFMMCSGVITFLMSVTVGFLRDYTNSYQVAFHFLTACMLILIIPWTLEFYYDYRNKRNSTK